MSVFRRTDVSSNTYDHLSNPWDFLSKTNTTLITKQYNYLFYLTVRILNWCSNNLIISPLISIFKLFSISEKRILMVKKLHIRPIDSSDSGSNVNYAFGLMMWTLTCLILTIELLILKTLKHLELENWIIILFTVAVFISILFNNLILWKSFKYETYFSKFKQEQQAKNRWILALAYHLTVMIICILTAVNT